MKKELAFLSIILLMVGCTSRVDTTTQDTSPDQETITQEEEIIDEFESLILDESDDVEIGSII